MITTCAYIFKKGKSVGCRCQSKPTNQSPFCKLHKKNDEKTNTSTFDVLPTHLVSMIMNNLVQVQNIDTKQIKLLHVLEATCKTFKNVIDQDHLYDICWSKFSTDHNIKFSRQLNSKQLLELYGRTGCQFCNKPRIRKVYENYNVRCCTDCLYSKTISNYIIRYDYKFNDFECLEDARKRHVDMYNPYARSFYNRSYTATFYWKEDVDRLIQNKYGYTLENHLEHWKQANYRDNYAKLQEICASSKYGVQPEDIINHSSFNQDAQLPITNLQKYYTCVVTNLRTESIKSYLRTFDDFASYDWKMLQKTRHFFELIKSQPQTYEPRDWSIIKEQAIKIEYKIHCDQFMQLFHPSQKVSTLQYVTDKIESLQRFTKEDEDIINQLSPIMKSFPGKCRYCIGSNRVFTKIGMRDHCRAVHHVELVV